MINHSKVEVASCKGGAETRVELLFLLLFLTKHYVEVLTTKNQASKSYANYLV